MTDLIARFAETHPEEARRIFDARIAAETDPRRVAELEAVREYLTNRGFRAELKRVVYNTITASEDEDDEDPEPRPACSVCGDDAGAMYCDTVERRCTACSNACPAPCCQP